MSSVSRYSSTTAGEVLAAWLPRTVRIVVADDHRVYRDGIVRALLGTGRYDVVGEAGEGRMAVELVRSRFPDLVLLDLRMPDLDGLGVLQCLRREGIEIPVVLLTAFPYRELVEQALAAGAAGCLRKDAAREEIVAALDAVASGGVIVRD